MWMRLGYYTPMQLIKWKTLVVNLENDGGPFASYEAAVLDPGAGPIASIRTSVTA